MIFSNGAANAGIGRPVVTYLNANGAMTFLSPDDWPVTPVNGDDFVIFATHVHPITQIQSGLATEAKQDIIDGNVDSILEDTGTTLPATLAALNDISVADILTTQMTEAYAADGTEPTLAQAIFLIQQTIGDFSISGTTLTAKELDGSTTAATYTLDDAVNPTSRTRAT